MGGKLQFDTLEPHLKEVTPFSRVLFDYKKDGNLRQLAKLLNIITKSKNFKFHSSEYDEDGLEAVGSVISLDRNDKNELNHLISTAMQSAIKIGTEEELAVLPEGWNGPKNGKAVKENVSPNQEEAEEETSADEVEASSMKRSNDGSIRKGNPTFIGFKKNPRT